jgi:phospholipid transport system substrate-binding protein
MIKLQRRAIVLFPLAIAAARLETRPAIAAGEPPQAVIQDFYKVLLDVMKRAGPLGFKGRYDTLKPALDATFDLPLMARLAVGPQWSSLTPPQQSAVTENFADLTYSTWASRFDGYDGERFETAPETTQSGAGTLVQTKLVKGNGEPVSLNYLMRQSDGSWKAIDVFLSGTISELAARRSEFSSVLRREGPDALLTLLRQRIAEMKNS